MTEKCLLDSTIAVFIIKDPIELLSKTTFVTRLFVSASTGCNARPQLIFQLTAAAAAVAACAVWGVIETDAAVSRQRSKVIAKVVHQSGSSDDRRRPPMMQSACDCVLPWRLVLKPATTQSPSSGPDICTNFAHARRYGRQGQTVAQTHRLAVHSDEQIETQPTDERTVYYLQLCELTVVIKHRVFYTYLFDLRQQHDVSDSDCFL